MGGKTLPTVKSGGQQSVVEVEVADIGQRAHGK
jgi:hypothetical protein